MQCTQRHLRASSVAICNPTRRLLGMWLPVRVLGRCQIAVPVAIPVSAKSTRSHDITSDAFLRASSHTVFRAHFACRVHKAPLLPRISISTIQFPDVLEPEPDQGHTQIQQIISRSQVLVEPFDRQEASADLEHRIGISQSNKGTRWMKRAGVSIELQQSASSVKVMSSKRRGVKMSVCEVMRMMMAAILADLLS